jgi:lipopolysaccharide/colanic/teichoic acid biosynthesis glycosyltransferase
MDGTPFTLLKFRTMRSDRCGGPSITAREDRRITALGRFMRASKLDELPQLLNVFIGEMSIVGPRPELQQYVKHYDASQRMVLEVRPGLTDPATLRFRDEERLLAAIEPAERETYYIDEIMPEKLRLNLTYLEQAGPGFDLLLILRTLGAIVVRRGS